MSSKSQSTDATSWGKASDIGDKNTEQAKFANKDNTPGAMHRPATKFHHKIGDPQFPAEGNNRYHLYVSEACPWAHRCHVTWVLKKLEGVVGLTLTGWKLENISHSPPFDDYHGWDFVDSGSGSYSYKEPNNFSHIEELYELAHPGYREEWESRGQRPYYAVPVLYDTKTKTIVSSESAEIIQMFNSAFNSCGADSSFDLEPASMKQQIEDVNAIVYPTINDGVYRCGFCTSQQAYENAYNSHWEGMDKVEAILGESRFLTGDTLTLSDIRLWTTLARYDTVYYSHFKTNRSRISEMPNLYRFLRDVYRIKGVESTLNLEWIKKHYYWSQRMVNPTGIWPLGMQTEDKGYWEKSDDLPEVYTV
ncbi:hypothetical protein TL16_g11391, partial [Triparma laevis f. inornata]|uniref:GST C-terminal domain-containing protein n=2 Tax=Triparma laevis TaxID=1534972 RepID=A0A9W7CE36_9STRA